MKTSEIVSRSGLIKPGEGWTCVSGFSKYLIGLHGAVMSVVNGKPRILKPIRMGNYLGLNISDDNGILHKRYLHRLVAEAAYGACPDGMECCHNDGNRYNNDASNLRWDTKVSNEADKIQPRYGELNVMAKYTSSLVREVRKRYSEGETQASIADDIGMSRMNVSRIVNRKLWRHI